MRLRLFKRQRRKVSSRIKFLLDFKELSCSKLPKKFFNYPLF